MHGLPRPTSERLRFFRPITQRIEIVGASLQSLASKYNLTVELMLQLSPEQIQITKDILALHAPGKRVCVYGSRAEGTARVTSDLDLLILDDKPLTPECRAELKLAFSESNLPFFVGIVEQARISSKFFEEITKQTEPLTHDLAVFTGKWNNDDLHEFHAATQSLRRIERDLWQLVTV